MHADLSEHCGGQLNDIVVDAQGRAYVGNFGFDLMHGADPADAQASCGSTPTARRTVVADDLCSRTAS